MNLTATRRPASAVRILVTALLTLVAVVASVLVAPPASADDSSGDATEMLEVSKDQSSWTPTPGAAALAWSDPFQDMSPGEESTQQYYIRNVGSVPVRVLLQGRPDFGAHSMRWSRTDDGMWTATGGGLSLRVRGLESATVEDGSLLQDFAPVPGAHDDVVVEIAKGKLPQVDLDASALWRATEHEWADRVPAMRGSIAQAPMSQPARPTRLNRKAVLERAVPSRRSEAIARMAPAPAQTPSIAATMGCGQARIAFTSSPVMLVNINSSGAFSRISGPMISCTSPPEQKLSPAPCSTTTCTSVAKRRRPNRSRNSA